MLHACKLGFKNPISDEQVDLEAPISADMQKLIELLRNTPH
jgi:hypothetical protein